MQSGEESSSSGHLYVNAPQSERIFPTTVINVLIIMHIIMLNYIV